MFVVTAALLVFGSGEDTQSHPVGSQDQVAILQAAAEHMRDDLAAQETRQPGETALDPREVCRPRACPTGWGPERADAWNDEISTTLSLVLETVAKVYLDAQFLGRPQTRETARISGVIALGRVESQGREAQLPVTVWWHADPERRTIYQRESTITLHEDEGRWRVTQVQHVRMIRTGG